MGSGKSGAETVILEYDADIDPVIFIVAKQGDLSAVGFFQSHNNAQESGLSALFRADDRDDRAGGDIKAHVFQAGLPPIVFIYIQYFDGHAALSPFP